MFICIKTKDYLKPAIINCAITSHYFLQNAFYHCNCHTTLTLFKVCSESLDTKSKNCDNSEDLSAIKKIFLEIEGIVKKHIFYLSFSEKVQKFALKSQK